MAAVPRVEAKHRQTEWGEAAPRHDPMAQRHIATPSGRARPLWTPEEIELAARAMAARGKEQSARSAAKRDHDTTVKVAAGASIVALAVIVWKAWRNARASKAATDAAPPPGPPHTDIKPEKP